MQVTSEMAEGCGRPAASPPRLTVHERLQNQAWPHLKRATGHHHSALQVPPPELYLIINMPQRKNPENVSNTKLSYIIDWFVSFLLLISPLAELSQGLAPFYLCASIRRNNNASNH